MQICQFYDHDGGTNETYTTDPIYLAQWMGYPITCQYLLVGDAVNFGTLYLRTFRADGTYGDWTAATNPSTTVALDSVALTPGCEFRFAPASGRKARLTLWMPMGK